MLSEPNVKVVFHQTAVPVILLSTWIIYPKRSALGHSTRCLAEAWLSEVDSLFCSRCRTCCAPLTKKGAGAAATWTPSFLLFPALSRAEPEFFNGWGEAFPYLNLAGILSILSKIGGGHRPKHDWKGPSYAMRSIQNLESCRDDKKRALSSVALKKRTSDKSALS